MNPGDEHVSPAAAPVSGSVASRERRQPADSRESLFDTRPPVATYLLLAANLAWFAAGLVVALRLGVSPGTYLWSGHPVVLDRLGAVSAASLLHGDWWRLLACCFVHVGFWHLLMNMAGLAVVGPLAEYLWGRKRVLVVYFLSGLGGSCLAMAIRPLDPGSGVPVMVAGASGALWGVMASLAAWLMFFRHRMRREKAVEFARRLGVAFAINIAVSILPGVSWAAHAGGGVVGFAAVAFLHAARSGGRPRRLAAWLLLLLVPVACVGGLVWSMRWGPAWAPLRRPVVREVAIIHHEAPAAALVWDAGSGAAQGIEDVARTWIENQEFAAILAAVSPPTSRPLEARAVLLLSREPAQRKPDEVEDLRKKLAAVQTAAGELARRVATPTGNPMIDAARARLKAAAESRAAATELLTRMLDSKHVPSVEDWAGSGAAKREAEARWAELDKAAP